MPFCPVCKSEYRDGFKNCVDCGHELVDSIPSKPPKEEKREVYIDDEPAFLTSGSSTIECGTIEGCLKTACIPFLKKDRETGGYMTVYMGFSVFGSDYYVPSKLLSKAKATLDACFAPTVWGASTDNTIEVEDTQILERELCSDGTESKVETNDDRTFMSRRTVAIIIILLFLLPMVVALIINFIQMFHIF
jgi:hypothetical protein